MIVKRADFITSMKDYGAFATKGCPEVEMCIRDSGQGPKEKPLAYYAARHQDADELARSSSGGVFSAIASFVLEQGGVVFGAVFNENWFVIHTHAETWEELRPMHGSKYIPSNIEAVYPQVETCLLYTSSLYGLGFCILEWK